jgi:outer membrane protein TolC
MLLAALSLATTCTGAMGQVSLATVVDLAQRNSTEVALAKADVNKARAALSESKDVVVPSLLLGTGIPVFPEVGFTGAPPSLGTATVQSVIFSFQQKRYINAASLGLKASITALRNAREQVALDASLAYIEFDTVSRELEVVHQQEGFSSKLVEIEQERTEAGVDPVNNLLAARLTAAQLKLKRQHLESRAQTLAEQLAALTGLPVGSITPDHVTIPEIPEVSGDSRQRDVAGIESTQLEARAKLQSAKGDLEASFLPQLNFVAQYNRNTTILNSVNSYFARPLPTNNFSSGISIQLPLFDVLHRAKARESAAEALRAKVEAEQARHQNDLSIVELDGSIRELATLEEIAYLKQQIADEHVKTVQTELEMGNGTGSATNATPQLSPKAEQEARIEDEQRVEEALDAGFDLAKARLSLLRALGHMDDWLHELNSK